MVFRAPRLDHLLRGIWELRVARMSCAKRAGPPCARYIRTQSCEDVSGETGRTTSRSASQSSEVRGCLRRNGPDHLSRGISEVRVSRMSQAKRAGPPRARHRRAQNFEDVSGETARTTSRTAPRGSEFRGCLKRNGQDHLSRGVPERNFSRMSQAKRPIPANSETRVVRMSQAKRPGPSNYCEDVSAPTSLGQSITTGPAQQFI